MSSTMLSSQSSQTPTWRSFSRDTARDRTWSTSQLHFCSEGLKLVQRTLPSLWKWLVRMRCIVSWTKLEGVARKNNLFYFKYNYGFFKDHLKWRGNSNYDFVRIFGTCLELYGLGIKLIIFQLERWKVNIFLWRN
jgi:hypothetical protein